MVKSFIRPRIALLHYTAPPVVGGVEAVIAEQSRLLTRGGYPTTIVLGRGGTSGLPAQAEIVTIPEIDSEYAPNLAVAAALEGGQVPAEFFSLRDRIEAALGDVLARSDIVVAHNVLTTHFNLPLTAALHRLAGPSWPGTLYGRAAARPYCARGQATPRSPSGASGPEINGREASGRLVAWAHDISRYVNPDSGAPQRSGFPWDLLRTHRPEVTYVAVSARRQRALAGVLRCLPASIHVISNGVDPIRLLGLSDLGQHLAETFGLLSADLVLLMPIRITRAKNIEYALHVTAALKAAGIRPRLVITGPPDPHSPEIDVYCAELHQLRRDLALQAEAIFIYEGTSQFSLPLMLDPSVVAELYRVCDLVLMPSHREGFGLPVLEAGLVDRPIFTTAVPAVEEIGAASVYLIQAGDPPEATAARLLDWARQDTAHQARRRVRQTYTWPAIFSNHIEPLLMDIVASLKGEAG